MSNSQTEPVALPELPEPAAHMYPSDLERFQTRETFAQAYSVAVGNPDERSVPLYTLSELLAHMDAALRAQAEEVDRLRAAGQKLLDALEEEAAATMALENAEANFSFHGPETRRAGRSVVAASVAMKNFRAHLAASKQEKQDA